MTDWNDEPLTEDGIGKIERALDDRNIGPWMVYSMRHLISALRTERTKVEELRAALEECVSAWDDYGTSSGIERVNRAIEKARAKLGEKP